MIGFVSSLVFVFVFCIQKNMKRKSESLTAGGGKVCSAVGRDGGVAAATDEATAANGSQQSVLGTHSVWASRWVSKTDILACLSMIWLAQNRVVLVNEKDTLPTFGRPHPLLSFRAESDLGILSGTDHHVQFKFIFSLRPIRAN